MRTPPKRMPEEKCVYLSKALPKDCPDFLPLIKTLFPQFNADSNTTGEAAPPLSGGAKGASVPQYLVIFQARRVPGNEGLIAALYLTSDKMSDFYDARPWFAVFKASGNSFETLLKKNISEATERDFVSWSGVRTESQFNFDLAPYQVNAKERAFGYRLWLGDGGSGASYGDETLHIFLYQHDKVTEIFSDSVSQWDALWQNANESDPGGVYCDWDQTAVLLVNDKSKDKTGNFEWLLRTTQNLNESKLQRKVKKLERTQHLHFDGKVYKVVSETGKLKSINCQGDL